MEVLNVLNLGGGHLYQCIHYFGCKRAVSSSVFHLFCTFIQLDISGLHIDDKSVGFSISQWLPCPLAIWNLLFGMAILVNLVKGSVGKKQKIQYIPYREFFNSVSQYRSLALLCIWKIFFTRFF